MRLTPPVMPKGRLFFLLARTTFRQIVDFFIYGPHRAVTSFFINSTTTHFYSLFQKMPITRSYSRRRRFVRRRPRFLRRRPYGMRRRFPRRTRGHPGSGMKMASWRPQGRIPRNFMRINRMQQFPTTVRVKFVQEAWHDLSISVGDATSAGLPIDIVPVTPFDVTWSILGSSTTVPTQPVGWNTWRQAYSRYKCLAGRLEIYAMPARSFDNNEYILLAKATSNNTQASVQGTIRDWLVDPTCKQAYINVMAAGSVQLNQPTLVMYVKPRDVFKNNQDWSVIEATMVAQPDRFVQVNIGALRVNSDVTTTISASIRVRLTTYVELFDRRSTLDTLTEPTGLMATLQGSKSQNDPLPTVPEVIVDRKVQVD